MASFDRPEQHHPHPHPRPHPHLHLHLHPSTPTSPPPYSPTNARPPPPQTLRSIDAISTPHRSVARMQAERNGAMPMPVGNAPRPYSSRSGDGGAMLRMAASPPKNKNTQHVPCKFFLQGQCQAGQMCPFSHDLESTTRPAPCKYFAKGGCKFGRKCALLHVTQDGTVVNRHYPPPQYHHAPAPAPPPPGAYGPPPPGLLSMQAQVLEQRPNGDALQQEFDHYQYAPRNGYDTAQQIDMTYTSASPKHGSPQNDRMGSSPPQQGLSIMDAPLPNSFDSNGISLAAMNGPFAASVPARFDLDSPPSSLPRKSQLGNTALRDLHNSAFGERGMDNVLASMGSSPPSGTDEPIKFEKRFLQPGRLRAPLSRPMVSASLGTGFMQSFYPQSDEEEEEEEEDEDTDREEDLLPSSLHDLIPEGRTRRISRSRNGEERPSSYLAAQRRTISGHGTPQESKPGSPLTSSSPSRYTGMFARQQMNGFGHVGSPLRDSSFPTSHPPGFLPSGELSPSISSPPRQASMSMLTQELQRTRLDAVRSASSQQAPSPQRTLSSGSARASMERNASSNSVSQRIDEEQELFDMDFEARPASNAGQGSGDTSPLHASTASVWNGKNATARFGPIGGGRTAK